MAFDSKTLDLNRGDLHPAGRPRPPREGFEAPEGWVEGQPITFATTLGRALFNELLPVDYPWSMAWWTRRHSPDRQRAGREVPEGGGCGQPGRAGRRPGFSWATRSGVTIAISDVVTPAAKAGILEEHEARAAKVQAQYEKGLIT